MIRHLQYSPWVQYERKEETASCIERFSTCISCDQCRYLLIMDLESQLHSWDKNTTHMICTKWVQVWTYTRYVSLTFLPSSLKTVTYFEFNRAFFFGFLNYLNSTRTFWRNLHPSNSSILQWAPLIHIQNWTSIKKWTVRSKKRLSWKKKKKEQHRIHTLEQILVVFYLINENLP